MNTTRKTTNRINISIGVFDSTMNELIDINEEIWNNNIKAGNISLKVIRRRKTRAIDLPDVYEIIFSASTSVATGLMANWLYDKIKSKTKKLRIEGKEVEVDLVQIEKAIEESVERPENAE